LIPGEGIPDCGAVRLHPGYRPSKKKAVLWNGLFHTEGGRAHLPAAFRFAGALVFAGIFAWAAVAAAFRFAGALVFAGIFAWAAVAAAFRFAGALVFAGVFACAAATAAFCFAGAVRFADVFVCAALAAFFVVFAILFTPSESTNRR
jgi:hypothetical protein